MNPEPFVVNVSSQNKIVSSKGLSFIFINDFDSSGTFSESRDEVKSSCYDFNCFTNDHLNAVASSVT